MSKKCNRNCTTLGRTDFDLIDNLPKKAPLTGPK
jgi:hypothetical protein